MCQMKKLSSFVVIFVLLTTIPVAHASEESTRYDKLDKIATAGGVVVSDSSQASQVGIDILRDGGNAVDAAIAMTFATGVTRPDTCGLGAGGHLVYRGADGTFAALDFRERAPRAMQQNTFNMASEGGSANELRPGAHGVDGGTGHMIVGVPGVVAGMNEALEKLGSGEFKLADLIAPAEIYAREGIKVTFQLQASLLGANGKFENYPESRRLYYQKQIQHGPFAYAPLGLEDPTVFKQEEYAKSLALIMKYGHKAFYRVAQYKEGPSVGKLIVEDMANAETEAKTNPVLLADTAGTPNDIGLITAKDLSSYEAIWKTPLVGNYRDHEVIAMPPPAGGMVGLEILNLLENFDLASFEHSSADHLHVMAEAQKLAWADRLAFLADPDFESVPTELLTSEDYARQRASEIDMTRAQSIDDYASGHAVGSSNEGTDTTHLSVIDRDGNAVAVTCSLETPFGSGVIAKGSGFFLNSTLGDFDWSWDTDRPPANAPAGGKTPRSAQSPTIVVKDDQPLLVTGGAGGPTIILGVVQNIVNVVDFGMDVFHAIDAPRMDAANAHWWRFAMDGTDDCGSKDLTESHLALEHNRIDDAVEMELEALPPDGRGHELCLVDSSDGYVNIPLIQNAGTDLSTGEHVAVSDPRGFWVDTFGVPGLNYYTDQGPMGQEE